MSLLSLLVNLTSTSGALLSSTVVTFVSPTFNIAHISPALPTLISPAFSTSSIPASFNITLCSPPSG